jgi:CRISPR-associated protein Csy1
MNDVKNALMQFLEIQKNEFLSKKINSEAAVKAAKLAYREQRYKQKYAQADQTKVDEALESLSEKQEIARSKHLPEATERYEVATWINKCLSNTQAFRATHVTKFSHSAISGVNPPLFYGVRDADGYLRTGNVQLKNSVDVAGDAVLNQYIFEFYQFLNSSLNDKKVIDCILEEPQSLQDFLAEKGLDFSSFKQKSSHHYFDQTDVSKSDGILKQVYFPVGATDYHLLSVVTPSCLIAETRQRINAHKFGATDDDRGVIKYARHCKTENLACDTPLVDYANLTEIGFGGSHPKNISLLCNSNGGRYYLLPCTPPTLTKREIQLPSQDFFSNALRVSQFKPYFLELHRVMKSHLQNAQASAAIQEALKAIIDQILVRAFQIRVSGGLGWSDSDHYDNLPLYQKIWLDEVYTEYRNATDEWATGIGKLDRNFAYLRDDEDLWLDQVIQACGQWIVGAYKATIKKDQKTLGDDELKHIANLIDIAELVSDAIHSDKEFFA